MAGWINNGYHMRMAVNLSGVQMRDPGIVSKINSVLDKYLIPRSRFTCEIAESVAMNNSMVSLGIIDDMQKSGMRVSIDDFGTGHSSLSALGKLSVTEIKIDKSFVSNIDKSNAARSIVSGIIGMAKSLKLNVVAEGVDTHQQKDILVSMGCNELQGYLFSIPVCSDDVMKIEFNGYKFGADLFRPSIFGDTTIPGYMG